MNFRVYPTTQFLDKSVESDFKEIVATLSKKNEMGAYTRYVTISFFEDKEANAP